MNPCQVLTREHAVRTQTAEMIFSRHKIHKIKRREINRIGHILRRNCLLNHVIKGEAEESIEVTGRLGRRRKQLLGDKGKRRYWKLKEEALDRTLWRTRFGRGYGPVVRQTTE